MCDNGLGWTEPELVNTKFNQIQCLLQFCQQTANALGVSRGSKTSIGKLNVQLDQYNAASSAIPDHVLITSRTQDIRQRQRTEPPEHFQNPKQIPYGTLAVIPKPDCPRTCPPPAPPSPVECVAEYSLADRKLKDVTAVSRSGDISGLANSKSSVDPSGMSRYQKQRFWGWLCNEDGRVDATHPALTRFRQH
ncbi:hypothetical protein BZA77DRAFT_294013 [Pyronema omphalodes]|nr:hypothetical protein BZA77DRAFT_294013 [Pyronema omphalodes]